MSKNGGTTSRLPTVPGAAVEDACSLCAMGSSNVLRLDKVKMCRCGRGECKILTSKREHSKGWRFYCCPISSGANNHGCGMFEWVVEEGGPSTHNACRSNVEEHSIDPQQNVLYSSSMYARGYLEGAIRGSEQQTNALKDVLAALDKLNVNKK